MTAAVLSYPGGKSYIARHIVAQMGPHRVYVEPFCGTAAVLMAKPRATFELINDLDGRLVTFLRVVRDRGPELAEQLALTPCARGEYYAADPDEPGLSDVEVARRVAVLIGQSFARRGLQAVSNGWAISISDNRAHLWADIPNRVLAGAERLRGVHIDARDALALIERYGPERDAVLYVDPPYLGITRLYTHEMEGDAEHKALADALHGCQAHVLLSGYSSALYDDTYADWERLAIPAYATGNHRHGSDPSRTDVLWSNRPLSGQGSFGFSVEEGVA